MMASATTNSVIIRLGMDLTALYLLALPAFLYWRAVRILAVRGYRVPWLQQLCWFAGLASIGAALLSPLDHLGDTDLLSAHMGQHLLIGDIAAPLLILGLRSPVYAFLLPRPALVPLARSQGLRRLFRALRRPLVAAPLWILILYGWHMVPAYEAALRSPPLHALQHQSFIIGSMLVWISVLEPARRRVPGGLWKIAHIVSVRFAGMFLGMAFLILRHPAYEGFYGHRALEHGLTPLEDQQIAGGLMLGLDFMVMIGALTFFFLRTAQDVDREEQRTQKLPVTASS
jgi:cytochrome c oxidase assembly factor CtaG